MNATNANLMKEKNRRLILDIIRKKECSRADISKETSLTKAAVSIIVDDLIRMGAVEEYKAEETTVGRRPILLKIKPDFMYAVGVNLTRSYGEMGLVDVSGNVLWEKRFHIFPKEDSFSEIKAIYTELLKETSVPNEKIYGVGVSAPGPLDVESTTILNPVNFEGWHYENIGLRLKKLLKKEIYLENVAGSSALCEKYFGTAKNMEDFLLLKVDEGIGSGIVKAGCLLREASEIGHTSISFDGIKCDCGNCGCVERYASIPAILKDTPYKKWADAVDSGDSSLIKKEAQYLSSALINAINLFGFESIFLDGDITYKAEMLIGEMKTFMGKNTVPQKEAGVFVTSSFNPVTCASVTVFDGYFNGI